MATMTLEKTQEELRKELEALQRQQREVPFLPFLFLSISLSFSSFSNEFLVDWCSWQSVLGIQEDFVAEVFLVIIQEILILLSNVNVLLLDLL